MLKNCALEVTKTELTFQKTPTEQFVQRFFRSANLEMGEGLEKGLSALVCLGPIR